MKHINRKEEMFVPGKTWVQTRKWLSLILAVTMLVLSVPQTALTVRAEETTDIVRETAEDSEKTGESFEAGETAKGAGEVADSESGLRKIPGGVMPESEEGTESAMETSEEGEIPETYENTQAVPEESSAAVMEELLEAAAAGEIFTKDYIIYEVISASEHTVKVKGMDRDAFNRNYAYDSNGIPTGSGPVEFTIPATVESGGVTWTVTEIGEFALADYQFDQWNNPGNEKGADTSIGTVGSPGFNLFISKVNVSSGIAKIGKGAFYRSLQINQILLPDTVVEIGEGAFYFDEGRDNQNSLKVNIPTGVRTIGDYAYHGVFFDGTLTIPNSVEVIGEYAFACDSEASGIRAVVIPVSVQKIHRYAFENATLTRAALYQDDAQLTLTEYLDGTKNIEYATWMFGHLNRPSNKRLTLYVPQELIERYKSSTLSDFFPKLMVRDIYGYRALKESPIRFLYNNVDTSLIEMPVQDPVPSNINASIKIDKGDALFEFDDIQWSFEIYETGETLTGTKLDECLSYTLAADGTMSLVFLKLQNYTLTANVTGYFPVYLDIILTGSNPGGPVDPGDDPIGSNAEFLNKVNALTAADIEKMKKVSYSSETAFQLEEIKAMAEKIIADAKAANDRDKILAVHTWLGEHIAYDYDDFLYTLHRLETPDWILENDEWDFVTCPPTSYGVLKNRYAVCDGYAKLAEDMLRSIGIPCAYIGGDAYNTSAKKSVGHAWNMAYDGQAKEWIYFDATWNALGGVSNHSIGTTVDPESDVTWFDFDVDAEMKAGRNFTRADFAEKSVSGGMVKSAYLTLFIGEEGKFQALQGYTDVTFRLDDAFKNTDKITLDASGNIMAKKPGMVQICIEGKGVGGTVRTETGYVRVLNKTSFAFKKDVMEVGAQETGWKALCLLDKKEVQFFTELTSSDNDVVTVKEDGTLEPKKAGTAEIKAKLFITAAETKPEISCTITVLAERPTFDDGRFKYRILSQPSGSDSGTVEITGHHLGEQDNASWQVEIPGQTKFEEKSYTVIGIGKEAFTKAWEFEDGAVSTGEVVLPDTLQYIEEYAFYGALSCKHPGALMMAAVNFPASLERIEEKAFAATYLTGNIVFPAGSKLKYIGDSAFEAELNLSKVDLSNCSQLQEIGESAFAGNGFPSDMAGMPGWENHGLKEVKLPEGLKTIGAKAFYADEQLSSIHLPSTLESIGDGAFRTTGLTSIQIPAAVKSIGDYAFSNTPLEGMVDISGVSAIGAGAFSITKIETVILPNELQKIPDEIFSKASGLKNVLPKSNLEELGGVENLSGGIFKLPVSVKSIGSEAFLKTALTGTVDISSVSAIGTRAFIYAAGIETIILPDALTEITDEAFGAIDNLKNVVSKSRLEEWNNAKPEDGAVLLSDKITKIGASAFDGCKNISSIEAPGVKELGQRVFALCANLKEVKLSDGLTVIPKQAFFWCEALDGSSLGMQKLKTIENEAFASTGLTGTVDISGVSQIGTAVFEGSRGIETIILPDVLTEIPEKSFSAMDNLKSVVSKSRLEEWNKVKPEDGAVLLSDKITKIGASAFEACLNIRSIELPGVKELGDQAFFRCEKLGSTTGGAIELGENIRTIGNRAFFLCYALKKVTFYSKVIESVGENCFYLPNAPEVYIYKNKLPSGAEAALKSCVSEIKYIDDTEVKPTRVTLNKTTLRLNMGGESTYKLTATVAPANATNKSVTWSSSNTDVATVGNDGTVTAEGAGTATITATAAGDNTRTATCAVTVVDYRISVGELNFDLASSRETKTLEITGMAPNAVVTWRTNNASVAAVTAVPKITGNAQAKVDAIGVGSTTIVAEVKEGGVLAETFTCTVKVDNNKLNIIQMSDNNCTLKPGDTKVLKVYYTPADTTAVETVKWSSSDTGKSVVVLDESTGKITAKGKGTVTITVTVTPKTGEAMTETCVVTVKDVTTKADADTAAAKLEKLTALTNVQPKLGDVKFDKDSGWEWVNENLELKYFAGDGEKYFAARYYKENDRDTTEPYVTTLPVQVSTVTGVKINSDGCGMLNLKDESKKAGTLSLEWVQSNAHFDMKKYADKVKSVTWTGNNKVAVVTDNKDGTATVKTAEKAGSATITLNVEIANPANANKPYKYKATYSVKVVDGAVATIDVVNNEIKEFTLKDGSYYGEVGENPKNPKTATMTVSVKDATSLSVKSSDTNVIAIKKTAGKADNTAKTYNGTMELTVKAAGTSEITLTANDAAKTVKTIKLYVTDPKPRISVDNVTINLQKKGGETFYLYPHDGYAVNSVGEKPVYREGKDKGTAAPFKIKYENGGCVVEATGDVKKNTTYKLNVEGKVKETGTPEGQTAKETPFTVPLTIKVEDKKPNYRVSQTRKVNLFYTDSKALLNITTSEKVTGVTLAKKDGGKDCDFDVQKVEETGKATEYYLKAKTAAASKSNNKGTLTITFAGYDSVTQDFTVNVEDKAPSLSLTSNRATLYAGLNTAVTEVKEGRDKWAVAKYQSITAVCNVRGKDEKDNSFETEKLAGGGLLIKMPTVPTDKAKTINLALALKDTNWSRAVPINYTVYTKIDKPALKLSKTTLKLNANAAFYRNTDMVDIMWKDGATFNPATDNVTIIADSKDTKAAALLNDGLALEYKDGKITAALTRADVPKGNYKFKTTVKVGTQTPNIAFNVNVTNDPLKLKLSKTTLKLNTNESFWAYDTDTTVMTCTNSGDADFNPVKVSVADNNNAQMKEKLQNGIEFKYVETSTQSGKKRQITARLLRQDIPKGTYKFKVNVPVTGALKSETALNVNIVDDKKDPAKSVALSQKGSIDVLNRDGTSVIVTPTLKHMNGEITGVELTGSDAHAFDVTQPELDKNKKTIVTIKAKDDVKLITNYDYKVKLLLTITNANGETINHETSEIKLRLKQGRPTVKMTPTGVVFFSGIEGTAVLDTVATLSKLPVPIDSIKLINYTTEFKAEQIKDEKGNYINGKFTIKSTKATAKNKTYSLKFEVKFKGHADNEKPTTVTYSVKVK